MNCASVSNSFHRIPVLTTAVSTSSCKVRRAFLLFFFGSCTRAAKTLLVVLSADIFSTWPNHPNCLSRLVFILSVGFPEKPRFLFCPSKFSLRFSLKIPFLLHLFYIYGCQCPRFTIVY